MNRVFLSDNNIRFINWLILMIERSGLSCDAHEGKFMIRHVSGLPLSEEILRDVLGAIIDEANRLATPINAYQSDGKILLTFTGENANED